MTEKSASPVAAAEEKTVTKMETTKKAGGPKAPAKPRVKPTHPSTADMVKTAIETLADRGGSSLQAIKKYIAATYKTDAEKQAPFIKKYLKAAVVAGTLVQTKGKGASGSFKLPVKKTPVPKTKPKVVGEKKAAKPKKPTSPKKAPVKKADAPKAVTKKPAAPKKAPVKKTPAGEKKAAKPAAGTAAKVSKPKSPSKTKKAVKAPTAKPKVPKPKKAASPKAAKPTAAKKAVAQKK